LSHMRSRRTVGTVLAAAGMLASVLAWNGAAQAVPNKGLNGLIACGGTLPTASPTVSDFEVYVMNPDGSNRTNITDENPITDYNPLWTADGKKIIYEAETVGQVIDDTFELWTMNPDGSGKSILYANGKPEDIPRGVHPDGSQIVVQSNELGAPNNEIFKMNADGTGKVNITNHPANDGWPRWSADGTRIFFHSNRSGNLDIWSMDPFGNDLVNLTAGSLLSDNTVEVSPDGRKLAFTRQLVGGNEIFTMNVDGTEQTNISNSPGYDSIVTWSPDGTTLIWTSDRTGDFEVFSAPATGGPATRLTFAPGFDGRCDWQRLCTINGAGDIAGTEGDDVICGSPGDDRIAGLGGNDILLGFGGNDNLLGGAGDDTLFGGIGNDSLFAQAGNDFSSAGPGADRISADLRERVDIGAGPGDLCLIGGVSGCPARLS
jgi:Ca2+-binding RTX toxin-like protein